MELCVRVESEDMNYLQLCNLQVYKARVQQPNYESLLIKVSQGSVNDCAALHCMSLQKIVACTTALGKVGFMSPLQVT